MSVDERPRFVSGLAAAALFVLLALVSAGSNFADAAGFPADASVTEGIGYTMFGMGASSIPAENFLAVFEIIDLVLVAALVASVLLAQRKADLAGPLEGGEQ